MKTFIRRLGNKTRHLGKIIPHLPVSYHAYLEPFLGSGALFLHLMPEKWIVNDNCTDLVDAWKLVRDDPETIVSQFKKFDALFRPLSVQDKKMFCRAVTENLNNKRRSKKRTVDFMLMTYCSYMGMIFSKNKFYFQGLDLAIASRNNYTFLKREYYFHLSVIHQYLQSNTGILTNDDYKKTLLMAKKGDFVFLDPPYVGNHTDSQYNVGENICIDFIEELYHQCVLLDRKGVLWLMTQADTAVVRKIFEKYTIHTFPVYRGATNEYKNELLIKNYG